MSVIVPSYSSSTRAPSSSPQSVPAVYAYRTAGRADVGRLSYKRQCGRARRIDFRAVHDGVLLRIGEVQLREMLSGELRPPARHEVVRRVRGVPAHQGVGDRRAFLHVLDERPVPRLMARYDGGARLRVDGIVGRVDRGLAAVLQRHEYPQARPGKFRVPLEANGALIGGCRRVVARAGARRQREDRAEKDGRRSHANAPDFPVREPDPMAIPAGPPRTIRHDSTNDAAIGGHSRLCVPRFNPGAGSVPAAFSGAPCSITWRAGFRRSGCWCRGSRRCARRGSPFTCAGVTGPASFSACSGRTRPSPD